MKKQKSTLSTNQLQIHSSFLPNSIAKMLRQDFLNTFEDPRRSPPKRFLWDHWYVEDQYKMHRTPAQDFFKPQLYKKLCDSLVRFGQEHLGCHTISKPWLSYYTDGDYQSLHTDSPHGPWAYVFSLTDWLHREFKGGETQLLNPQLMNYWSHFPKRTGLETNEILLEVEPRFNQLLIFDPRIPHGVKRLGGIHEPSLSRLVVHGWFVQPEPYLTGALAKLEPTSQMESINDQLTQNIEFTKEMKNLTGTIIFRMHILKTGKVGPIQVLTNNLIDRASGHVDLKIEAPLNHVLKKMTFQKQKGSSQLTLPLIF